MKILLTNDDGYRSEAYQLLGKELQKKHDVTMIAPEKNCSGISHAFTLLEPLFSTDMQEVENSFNLKQFSHLSGTPVDCVKFCLLETMKKDLPDLVISGINYGANLACDVLYSGTVGAAVESYIHGVSSIALSYKEHDFPKERVLEMLEWFTPFLDKIESHMLEKPRLLNINYPPVPKKEIRGVKACEIGTVGYKDFYDKRVSPLGKTYFWLSGVMEEEKENKNSDKYAIQHNYISVSPLKIDFTNYEELNSLKSVLK
ncbi:MAG: 5'/3'-nucleotidase SurE [Candidatus Cloacimonadota bacterium]|nr:MAG: 5'/3'-nucleotidase SurE [Candidatus Cloacimonadota bacterium]